MNPSKLIAPYRIDDGRKFHIKQIDPDDIGKNNDKEQAKELLAQGVKKIAELQEKLYAQNQWALLLIFQAMDAAGKDSTIKHVMSGVNPQGCQVHSFKAPSQQELDHDFLWRTNNCLPARGMIGIFNRSYYEEVLVVRVHPEYLDRQRLPAEMRSKNFWNHRYEDINNLERYLTRNGVAVRKFFLHVSKEEQKRRFLSRLEEPSKNWKFSADDSKEREHWDDYMNAYEKMIQQTSHEHAPWFVVPADHKWYMRLVVVNAVIDALEELKVAFPKFDESKRAELEEARRILEREKD